MPGDVLSMEGLGIANARKCFTIVFKRKLVPSDWDADKWGIRGLAGASHAKHRAPFLALH